MRRFGETASGVSSRFGRFKDTVRKLGAVGAWLCFVLLLGLAAVPTASAQTVTYIHTDALGSVVAKSYANGNVIERITYEPYGAIVGGHRARKRCGHWAELHVAAVHGSATGRVPVGGSSDRLPEAG